MKIKTLVSLCLLIISLQIAEAQYQLSSAEIYEELQKFNFLGSALYVAAHPDDENTRLISYLSNGLHARTAYISLTRGDGGQNLIGTEISQLLGVLRSQELQMARATDGGQQFFTRANDFGYSKHPDETLEIWNKDQVLADLIYAIRYFKPDVIVNRFDHRTPGKTHGHHTSSAMLSVEAFDLAGDKTVYPEQLKKVSIWQPTRQFMNTSWWFYGSRENFAKADKSNMIAVDAGVYFPTLGISNNEISALARSKHLSQGFGSAGDRGSYQEYLELINGEMPENKDNLFGGINTSWSRVEGGEAIEDLMDGLLEEFDFRNPSKSLSALLTIYDKIINLEEGHWKPIKLKHLTELIFQCAGVHIEASTDQQQATRGDSIEVLLEVTNRSNSNISVNSISINKDKTDVSGVAESFVQNKWYKDFLIDKSIPYSNPYWLDEKAKLGTYNVDDMATRILPQSPGPVKVTFEIEVEGRKLSTTKELVYRYVNPAEGEVRQPFVVIPPVSMTFDKEMYLIAEDKSMPLEVKVRAGMDMLKGELSLSVPSGWSVDPSTQEIDIKSRGFETSYSFMLKGPGKISTGEISASVKVNNQVHNKSLINIAYDHVPLQTVLLPAVSKVVKVPLKRGGQQIGYVMGAGDKMPESLQSVGYDITLIEHENLSNENLAQYDAIVVGIRAYNTLKSLKLYNDYLYDYAEKGGTLIVQYNTSRRLNYDDLAPYPLQLSRKRVTDEYAEMRIVNPDHAVMNYPNKITKADFDGWVQERGLYFADEWDDAYETIISCNDKGEDPQEGSLLIAPHGDGHFVYTSISWFRQLPAGVPGAYRLFSNILALSSSE